MRKIILIASLIVLVACDHTTETPPNYQVDNNENWSFQIGDYAEAKTINFDDSHWRILDVPHDWSIEGNYSASHPMGDRCGYLPAGIAWYRKTIEVPDEWQGKQVEIEFDGVFMNSTVYANGKALGTHPYGWTSFAYNISDLVAKEQKITFAVHVDNHLQPSARWYTGSGIYAPTRFNIKENINIPRNGVFIKTKGGQVEADIQIANLSGKTQNIDLKYEIISENQDVVTELSQGLTLDESSSTKPQLNVKNPDFWDLETPHLYYFVTTISQNGKTLHQEKTRFGFRDIRWETKTGFWLNGRNIKLQGVCNHQDAGALGAAVPGKIIRFRIQQLKAMGVNAIRTAHNPQTPDFYRACDELGMLVMDEIFDGWHRKAPHDYGARFFEKHWQSDIKEWIERDRNHPSIVIYSVGNETQGEVASELVKLCHQLDNTRPVTSGDSNKEAMDVYGLNGHSERKGFMETKTWDRPFIGTENPHTWQVRGYYRTKTWYRNGYPDKKQKPYWIPDLTQEEVFHDSWTKAENFSSHKQIFNSSYDNATVRLTARKSIEQLRDIPHYSGSFRWTGHDYIGEAGFVHGGWPYRAFMGGAIDLANFEKDLYYLYQSQWTEEAMVYILPHWTHPTIKEGTEIPVWVYSNCDEVELFLNGKSLGTQKPGFIESEMQCQWMVPYKPGELRAIGYIEDKRPVEERVKTASAPAQVALSIDGEPLAKAGKDIVQVRVSAQDQEGNFYPYGENRNYFHVMGGGKIKALDNGSPVDVEAHYGVNSRIGFYGLSRAYIESDKNDEAVALIVASIIGEKKLLTSNLVNIDVEQINLRGQQPKADIAVYYTTDGSTPSKRSTPYTKAFAVEKDTNVKAVVYINGKEALHMEERFGDDVGFIFDDHSKTPAMKGEQAELATIKGGKISQNFKNYKGQGFVELKQKGHAIEWYLENDGSPENALFTVNFYNPNPKQVYATLDINGKKHRVGLIPGNGWRWESSPSYEGILGSGANTVTFTLESDDVIYVDYLMK